jgi:archaellum component FlaF (FlaF/FlaG flagellin family)
VLKFQKMGRRSRAGISPFLATVILVVITLMIGGILYSSFRQMVVAQVKNPSMTLAATNVSPDGETMILNVKNDGNIPIALQSIDVTYGSSTNVFVASGIKANITLLSSSAGGLSMQPGDSLTTKFKTSFAVPAFATFTVTVVGDQVAKAFNIQA